MWSAGSSCRTVTLYPMRTEIGASIFPWTKPASSHVGQPRAILEPTITYLSSPSATDIPLERCGKGSQRADATVVLHGLVGDGSSACRDNVYSTWHNASTLQESCQAAWGAKGKCRGVQSLLPGCREILPFVWDSWYEMPKPGLIYPTSQRLQPCPETWWRELICSHCPIWKRGLKLGLPSPRGTISWGQALLVRLFYSV